MPIDAVINAVVWDIDDTIFDHSGAERAGALLHLAAEGLLGRYADEEAAATHWRDLTDEVYQRFLTGELSFQEQRRERVRVMVGEPLTDAEADAWFARYVRCYEQDWRLFPDVLPALDALAPRFRHSVLSNSALAYQEAKLRTLGVRDRFEAVLCSGELGVAKPAAAAFHAACAALDLPPSQVAYVGDRHDVDAAGAEAAGLTGIWLDRTGRPATGTTAAGSVHRITTLAELLPLLAG